MAMTPEEQKLMEAMKAENEQLKKNQAEQNSYITKLEAQRGQAAPATPQQQPAAPQVAGAQLSLNNPMQQKWMEKQMKRDAIAEVTPKLIQAYGEPIFKALESDWLAFVETNADLKDYLNEKFLLQAFSLAYGEAVPNQEHALHQIGKSSTPPATPNQNGTNANAIAQVQRVISGQPPVMTPSDSSAANGTPTPSPKGPASTKDAFKGFADKLRSGEGNKFQ